MTEQEDLIDMAHTIIVRMAMRGGHDSYTGALMGKWLRMYESRPTPLAPDTLTCVACDKPIENKEVYCFDCYAE